jgi:hypothetical protein
LVSLLLLIPKAVKRPSNIWLFLWSFGRLWWVDRHLQRMAIQALNSPSESQPISINPEVEHSIKRRAAAIAWTARYHPCHPQCLHRSLVLYEWLKNQGISAQLEVGWGDGLGHAWVSYGGQVLNDRADIAEEKQPLEKISVPSVLF